VLKNKVIEDKKREREGEREGERERVLRGKKYFD
jgi:hypothetical protein